MVGIEIRDTNERNILSFDVRDILPLIGEPVHNSVWKCRDLECLGERSDEIHQVDDTNQVISGREFEAIMNGVYQTIDGVFEAFHENEDRPWLVIKAVDSSLFEVWSQDTGVIMRARSHFVRVSDIDPECF